MCAKFLIKVRKYDFLKNLDSIQGSLENLYIKSLVASPNHNRNSNSFRIFPRILCTICRENIIKIGNGHLAEFPRKPLTLHDDRVPGIWWY
jgi:hypothetical protein